MPPVTWSDPTSSATERYSLLLTSVQDYLDALYNGDVPLFERVFHAMGRLTSTVEGQIIDMGIPEYMKMVAGRPSPADRNDPRMDQVLHVSMPSPTTAHARVNDAYLPKFFTDDLTFIWDDNRWQIIQKVWHFTLI
jgi:hypothetical protein